MMMVMVMMTMPTLIRGEERQAEGFFHSACLQLHLKMMEFKESIGKNISILEFKDSTEKNISILEFNESTEKNVSILECKESIEKNILNLN